jgi:hypothetical protein
MKSIIRLCVAIMAAAHVGIVQAEDVGIVGAANPASTGAYLQQQARVLEIGQTIVFQEKITTDAEGSAQLAFVDGSAMSVGRNSTLIIDEFVYDPASGAGKMSARLLKGALRFVGGAVSHQNGATIETPTAVISVRGGIVTLEQDTATLYAVNHFGIITIKTAREVRQITRQDVEVNIGQDGAIKFLGKATHARLSALGQMLTSVGPQTGGSPRIPTDQLLGRVATQSPQKPGFSSVFVMSEKASEGTASVTVPQASSLDGYPCTPYPSCDM